MALQSKSIQLLQTYFNIFPADSRNPFLSKKISLSSSILSQTQPKNKSCPRKLTPFQDMSLQLSSSFKSAVSLTPKWVIIQNKNSLVLNMELLGECYKLDSDNWSDLQVLFQWSSHPHPWPHCYYWNHLHNHYAVPAKA